LDVYYGDAGDDILGAGMWSTDWWSGTLVNGIVRGNDYHGGAGNDWLRGTRYSDYYYFNIGDGKDVIDENNAGNSDSDRIILGEGITKDNVKLYNDGTHLYINIIGTDDVLKVNNWFIDGNAQMEFLEFADGTVWDKATISAKAGNMTGTEGNDTIQGTWTSDTIHALGGNDILLGREGLDVYYGDAGDDILGAGLWSFDWWNGLSVNGIIRGNDYYGGTGNDLLRGTRYSDYYYFNIGDGQDVIDDYNGGNADTDRIILGEGITQSDLNLYNDGTSLFINIGTNGDRIKINNWFSDGNSRIEFLEFADGTVWNQATIQSRAGSNGNDTLTGFDNQGDWLTGLGGNDTINGLG
ncbi:MAG: hypothetical protein H7833_21005, partial [Magnetococcus sp. DMHC-1]